MTFKNADLRSGDIILIEESRPRRSVVQFFTDLISWLSADVKPVNFYDPNAVTLEDTKISSRWTFAHLCKIIGDRLKVNPKHLRLSITTEPINSNYYVGSVVETPSNIKFIRTPTATPTAKKTFKPLTVATLLERAGKHEIITIKYEVTEEPVEKAEHQSRFFVESNLEKFMPRAVYLTPFVSTVADLIRALGIKEENVSNYRLLEAIGGKIRRTFFVGGEFESLTTIEPEKCSLYLEEIPKGESKSIACFTFEKNPTRPFGFPFKIDLRPDEPIKALKQRLAQKLAVSVDAINALFLFNGQRDRKLDDPAECLANLPGGNFSDENDQLGIMLAERSKIKSAASDGAIRFRK